MLPRYKGIPKIDVFEDIPSDPDLPYSYIKFMEDVSYIMLYRPALRQGQVMSNIIERISPDFFSYIVDNHQFDPFYDNKKIPKFIIKCFEFGILK